MNVAFVLNTLWHVSRAIFFLYVLKNTSKYLTNLVIFGLLGMHGVRGRGRVSPRFRAKGTVVINRLGPRSDDIAVVLLVVSCHN